MMHALVGWMMLLALASAWGQTPRLGPADGLDLPASDLNRVRVGTAAPDFTLESRTGDRITLSSFRGKKDVILIFYRGHW